MKKEIQNLIDDYLGRLLCLRIYLLFVHCLHRVFDVLIQEIDVELRIQSFIPLVIKTKLELLLDIPAIFQVIHLVQENLAHILQKLAEIIRIILPVSAISLVTHLLQKVQFCDN